jgi:hypothetical protein
MGSSKAVRPTARERPKEANLTERAKDAISRIVLPFAKLSFIPRAVMVIQTDL